MIDRLKIWLSSKSWFWKLRTWHRKFSFFYERSAYKTRTSVTKATVNIRILGALIWVGVKSLILVIIFLAILTVSEKFVRSEFSLLVALSADDKKFNIEQLRLYAELLTAIFSIYFATIGIILSAGYTKLRRDIIQMLTNEQVGSVYSRVLVLAAMFCLAATALSSFGFEPGQFVYTVGTTLTLLSALALFPLGQRLFNFFDLNLLVRSEMIPSIARHIECVANPKISISLANHHSREARRVLEQLSYIDDNVKADKKRLDDTLPALNDDFTTLLLHYLQQKHTIAPESHWFPRRRRHKQWFFAGDTTTAMALEMSSQQLLVEQVPDYKWFENEVVNRLTGHVELAFQVGDLNLASDLIYRLSNRTHAYAKHFQFEIGMQELERFKEIIEHAFSLSDTDVNEEKALIKIGIADAWTALGSNLCIETLRRMMTFEQELEQFFVEDEWNEKSLRRLPAALQVELAFIVQRIEFELEIEGIRLSKRKYVQQLAVQVLLQHYATVLPAVRNFYQIMIPDFANSLVDMKMAEAATQVVLSSLHSHWKLLNWIDDLDQLIGRFQKYSHYSEDEYKLPTISISDLSEQIISARENAIEMICRDSMVEHIFYARRNEDIPDHFGQIYYELAEACVSALEQNSISQLNKSLPMFLSLAFLANSKFIDPSLDLDDEFRLHLVSTVINDLACVLGFAILYGAYFDNEKLSENALKQFDSLVDQINGGQPYLENLVRLSNPRSFSMMLSPRTQIRINWKISFERRADNDGFGGQMGLNQGAPHPNSIVREFLNSFSDASHLFFAMHVVPKLDPIDFEIDPHITSLARSLSEVSDDF